MNLLKRCFQYIILPLMFNCFCNGNRKVAINKIMIKFSYKIFTSFLVTFILILVAIGIDVKGVMMGIIALLSLLFVIWAFLSSRGPGCKEFKAPWLDYILNNVYYIIPIFIALGVLWFIMRSNE